ncbi:hypothetical protein STEG23_013279, partial [Scotinomys teguina]
VDREELNYLTFYLFPLLQDPPLTPPSSGGLDYNLPDEASLMTIGSCTNLVIGDDQFNLLIHYC